MENKTIEKNIVRLRYEFEFEPGSLWSRKSEFDTMLNQFFTSHNIKATRVKFIGANNENVIRLEKMSMAKPIKQPEISKNKIKTKNG